MIGESSAKKSEFLVNLDHFSKYLKYLRNFEKLSNDLSFASTETKN